MTSFKSIIAVFVVCFVALASASTLLGTKDILGNYYDPYTGQYSSSLTGQVYNTVPTLAAAPIIRPGIVAAAPAYAAHVPVAAAPLWLRR